MKRSVLGFAFTIAVLVVATAASAEQGGQRAVSSDVQAVLLRQQAINDARAPIKSAADLQRYLSAEPSASPFRALSPDAKDRFIASLRFSDQGLSTYSATDLKAQLSASQAYEILSLFGVQEGITLLHGARIDTDADAILMADVRPKLICIPDEQFGCAPGTGGDHGGGHGGGGSEDHPHYFCESPHNCRHTVEDVICTHNC